MMVVAKNGHSNNPPLSLLEKISLGVTRWIGTPYSVIIHTLIFSAIPALGILGILDLRFTLLIFTTWLSVEAIYLSIFIQMSVNRATESLEEVEEDIEDIQEESFEEEEAHKVIVHMAKELKMIQKDLNTLKKKGLI